MLGRPAVTGARAASQFPSYAPMRGCWFVLSTYRNRVRPYASMSAIQTGYST